MIEFNIYFCIKQGKSATLSTLKLGKSPLERNY